MKAFYPRFIRKGPTFLGLNLTDLSIISFSLILALTSSMPILGLILSVVGIALNKFVLIDIDITGLFLWLYRKKTISWSGNMIGGSK